MTSKIQKMLLGLLMMVSGMAMGGHHVHGIVEENNLWIGPEYKNADMTEDVFNSTIEKVEKIYAPVVAERGATLEVIRKWEDGTVNAYAQQQGSVWKVTMFGGLARHDATTTDGFTMVICHELGHHLGGAPKKKMIFWPTWASNEGQSDYWASLKCMRRVFEKDNNVELMSKVDVPELVKVKCAQSFSNSEEAAICQRSAMAGLSLGNLFRALRNSEEELSFSTPDRSVVSATDDKHPASQCRLDTYFAGALCSVAINDEVDDKDPARGSCTRDQNFKSGVRPLCWYKPGAAGGGLPF